MNFSINLNPSIPALPRIADKKKINVRYMLIPPYASAHIYWNEKIGELVYEIEEPLLNESERAILEKIESAMLELINVNVAVEKTIEATSNYIDRTARLLIDELNIKITSDTYNKIFYYLFRDFIGFNEIYPMLKDYFIEDIECNGVDTPVYIIHRVYRNLRTNLVYKDMDKLASFVEKIAQRSGRYISYAQPLLDATLPDGSLDYTEPVIYKERGTVKVGKIGEVVDKYYKKEESNKPINIENIEVACFDDKFKIKWKKAQYVYRHKINEDLYNLDLEFGRKIKLTGNHSVFVVRREGVRAEKTDRLKEGDYVILPATLPQNNIISEINLADELSKTEHATKLVLSNVPAEIYEKNKAELFSFFKENYVWGNQTYYEHRKKRILPIKLYYLLSSSDLEKTRIKTTSSVEIKSILKVNRDLMRFLGLYIAEGWITKAGNHSRIEFCLNKKEKNLVEDLKKVSDSCFGVYPYIQPEFENSVKVTINSYILAAVMKDVLEISRGAKNKRVPEIVFNVSKDLQEEFIKAWNEGDYGTTVSEGLANDISYLALFNDDIAAFYKSKPKKTIIRGREIQNQGAYYTNFYARTVNNSYPSMVPVEILNPLNKTHMRLSNKRISKERLLRILKELRYKRFENIERPSNKFMKEWERRGFFNNGNLTEEGDKLICEINLAKKLIESEFCFAKIRKISRVKPTTDYVYDFSVEGDENFVGGTGGICCHNSRVQATFTKDVTSRGPSFSIRKFTKVPWTPTQLIAMGTLSPEMLAYFWILIENKSSILISGGTASGKTTLLNALAFFIPPSARVVSIEDTREISLPRENWLPAVARTSIGAGKVGEVDLFSLLKSSFRQNPDYLIVGEVRGKEAFVLFQGMASGHSSLSTMHADSVDTLIRRLQTPPINLSPTLVNSLDCVAIATHATVNKHETRRLREIVEIVNVNKDGTALINTPFTWAPDKDVFYSKKQSKVFEKISARKGLSMEWLQRELLTRTKLLYELYKRKIYGFDEIQAIINKYYKNPAEVLAMYSIQE